MSTQAGGSVGVGALSDGIVCCCDEDAGGHRPVLGFKVGGAGHRVAGWECHAIRAISLVYREGLALRAGPVGVSPAAGGSADPVGKRAAAAQISTGRGRRGRFSNPQPDAFPVFQCLGGLA
ncbi:MAG: hypothetical protein EP341_01105 [Sphingomonadales bacterium]|nr:MAG: hypothetical protein EP341_01105 [Sphingomonadales bacterium]